MFNIYIHDYFLKCGFVNAAREFALEAKLDGDVLPPINANNGFLLVWWNVFWLFFTTKTTGDGPDNVLLYFHWIQKEAAERTRILHEEQRARLAGMPLSGPPLPGQALPGQPLPGQPQPPRAAIRPPPPNGIRPPGMVNGPVTMPQGPSQAGPSSQGLQYTIGGVPHGPIPASHQPPVAGPSQPQMNGNVDPSTPHGHPLSNPQRPPSEQQSTRPGPHGSISQLPQGHPPPSHPNALPHLQPSQRQVPRGQHDAIRPPGQFHSPTIAPSHPPGPGPQGPLVHPHIPGMGPGPQMAGPSGATHLPHQHLSRGPQGGPPNTASPRNPSQTPTQPYQQLMNPGGTMGPPTSSGSRSGTPGGNTLTQQSPALAAREPPPQGHGPGPSMSEEMSRRYQQQHQHHIQQQRQQQAQAQQQDQQQRNIPHDQIDLAAMETNLGRIPKVFLHPMMAEAGCNDGREVENLSFEEKTRLNEVFKRTMNTYTGGAPAAPRNASASRPGMSQPPPMSGMPMGPPQGPSRPRGQKRSSTSPSDEQGGESTPKDQSPPERERDRKRPRHSPPGGVGSASGSADPGSAPPPMGSMGGFPPNHPANRPGGYPGPIAPQHPQSLSNGFRGPMGGPMNPHPGQQPVPNVGGMGMGGIVPGMVHSMPPTMGHMTPALTNQHIHQMPNSQVPSTGRPPLASPEIAYPFQNQSQMQQQMHYRQTMANQHMHKMSTNLPSASNSANPNPSPSTDPHDNNARAVTAGGSSSVGNRPPQQGKPGSMMPPPSPAHRPENANVQKGPGMMPPPAQPASAPGNPGGASKEQTAPSPAGGRHEGTTGSSPSIRPASRSGAGASVNTNVPSGSSSMPQGGGGGPPTPASAGGNNTNNASSSNTTAPSPAAVLANRISPSAAMNSLPRPQTSGPDSTVGNTAGNVQPPPPPPSAPPTSNSGLPSSLFGDFFDSMEDNFGLESLESIDPAEFSQWIDMNPLS